MFPQLYKDASDEDDDEYDMITHGEALDHAENPSDSSFSDDDECKIGGFREFIQKWVSLGVAECSNSSSSIEPEGFLPFLIHSRNFDISSFGSSNATHVSSLVKRIPHPNSRFGASSSRSFSLLRISPMTGDRKSLFSVCTRVRV
jgi:hypothetical protein